MVQSLSAQEDSTSYEKRPFQFTFLFPPLSTNGAKNARIVNDVSLNLFLGVSGGVEAFEAGLFLNIDQYYMHGVQLAGFGNTVGGDVSGAQVAGIYNLSGAHAQGFQGAGLVNVSSRGLNGAQVAGLVNVAGSGVSGFQGAGLVNVAGRNVKGAQVAGLVNVAGDSLEGFQGAGFVNVADRATKGVQAAGFGNVIGGGATHFQGAGFFNVAEEVKGAQVAGFVNVAGTVKGFQGAGFLNICDSIDGISLALIPVVRKNGYRKFALSISEVQYVNLSFRLGVRQFYNIYSIGMRYGVYNSWLMGGGFGTEMDLTEKLKLNIEGTVHQEFMFGTPPESWFLYVDRLNLYNTVKCLFGWKVGEKTDLHIGPTFNVSVAHSSPDLGTRPWSKIPPYSFYNRTGTTYKQTNVQMWVGLEGRISF